MERRIVLFGASTMAGFWDPRGGWFSRLREEVDRYQLENAHNHYQMYNCSISGDTSEGLRRRINTELKARNHEKKQMFTLISIGGNDAQYSIDNKGYKTDIEDFRENFNEILDIAEELSDKVAVISGKPMNWSKTDPCEWDDGIAYRRKDILRYENVKKQICERKDIVYIDLMEKIDEQDFKEKLEDGVHPNEEGHKQMKRILKKELQEKNWIPETI